MASYVCLSEGTMKFKNNWSCDLTGRPKNHRLGFGFMSINFRRVPTGKNAKMWWKWMAHPGNDSSTVRDVTQDADGKWMQTGRVLQKHWSW